MNLIARTLADLLSKLQKPKERPPQYVILGHRIVPHRQRAKIDDKVVERVVSVTITRVMPRRMAEQLERDRERQPYSRKRERTRRRRQMAAQLREAAK